MSMAALLLTIGDAGTKYLTRDYGVGQVLAFRQGFGLLAMLPYIHWATGWGALRVVNGAGVALRAVFFIATTWLIVTSFSLLPLTLVTAVAFSSPVFVVALSTLALGERVGPRRWLAVLAGFTGVLVIVRPGGAGFELALIVPVLAALSSAFRDLATRRLSKSETSIGILFWSMLAVTVFSGFTAIGGWDPMTPGALALMAGIGVLNALAHFLMIDSLRLGDASLVAPFRYTSLVWAAILGILIWNDWPDFWTLAGAAIIVAGGVYIIEREPGKAPEPGD